MLHMLSTKSEFSLVKLRDPPSDICKGLPFYWPSLSLSTCVHWKQLLRRRKKNIEETVGQRIFWDLVFCINCSWKCSKGRKKRGWGPLEFWWVEKYMKMKWDALTPISDQTVQSLYLLWCDRPQTLNAVCLIPITAHNNHANN